MSVRWGAVIIFQLQFSAGAMRCGADFWFDIIIHLKVLRRGAVRIFD